MPGCSDGSHGAFPFDTPEIGQGRLPRSDRARAILSPALQTRRHFDDYVPAMARSPWAKGDIIFRAFALGLSVLEIFAPKDDIIFRASAFGLSVSETFVPKDDITYI